MSSINLFALLTVILASVLSVWHVKTWEATKAARPVAPDLDFIWRQTRRRLKVSSILGMVGVAAFAGQFLQPALRIFVWAAIVMLTLWMMLLAVVDMMAIRRHFSQIRSGQVAEYAKLRAEIEQIHDEHALRKAEANGHDRA